MNTCIHVCMHIYTSRQHSACVYICLHTYRVTREVSSALDVPSTHADVQHTHTHTHQAPTHKLVHVPFIAIAEVYSFACSRAVYSRRWGVFFACSRDVYSRRWGVFFRLFVPAPCKMVSLRARTYMHAEISCTCTIKAGCMHSCKGNSSHSICEYECVWTYIYTHTHTHTHTYI